LVFTIVRNKPHFGRRSVVEKMCSWVEVVLLHLAQAAAMDRYRMRAWLNRRTR
jgi:hypothetical protein